MDWKSKHYNLYPEVSSDLRGILFNNRKKLGVSELHRMNQERMLDQKLSRQYNLNRAGILQNRARRLHGTITGKPLPLMDDRHGYDYPTKPKRFHANQFEIDKTVYMDLSTIDDPELDIDALRGVDVIKHEKFLRADMRDNMVNLRNNMRSIEDTIRQRQKYIDKVKAEHESAKNMHKKAQLMAMLEETEEQIEAIDGHIEQQRLLDEYDFLLYDYLAY